MSQFAEPIFVVIDLSLIGDFLARKTRMRAIAVTVDNIGIGMPEQSVEAILGPPEIGRWVPWPETREYNGPLVRYKQGGANFIAGFTLQCYGHSFDKDAEAREVEAILGKPCDRIVDDCDVVGQLAVLKYDALLLQVMVRLEGERAGQVQCYNLGLLDNKYNLDGQVKALTDKEPTTPHPA